MEGPPPNWMLRPLRLATMVWRWSPSGGPPSDKMRVPRSQPMMIESSTPGMPTHSNTTQPGRSSRPSCPRSAPVEPRRPGPARPVGRDRGGIDHLVGAHGASACPGGTATKSAATIGPAPRRLSVAITASAMAPHPITSGISLWLTAARRTADQPTPIASAMHTTSSGRSDGHHLRSSSRSARSTRRTARGSVVLPDDLHCRPLASITGMRADPGADRNHAARCRGP